MIRKIKGKKVCHILKESNPRNSKFLMLIKQLVVNYVIKMFSKLIYLNATMSTSPEEKQWNGGNNECIISHTQDVQKSEN